MTEPHNRGRAAYAVLGAIALVTVVDALVVARKMGRFTSADQTILWDEARDWSHGTPHQLAFYGQRYGTSFEAIPIAALHAVRASYASATPLALAGFTIVSWLLLGLVAARRHRFVAAAAFAAPVLLSTRYAVLTTYYSPAVGRFLAVVAAAIALHDLRRTRWLVATVFLGALALVIDPSTLVLTGPVFAYVAIVRVRSRRDVVACALATVPAVAWVVFSRWFFRAHPDYAIFPSPQYGFHLDALKHSFDTRRYMFGLYAPELLHSWIVPVIVVVAVCVAAIIWRRWVVVVPTALLAVGTIAAMSTTSATSFPQSVTLPGARVLLMLPFALWFVVYLLVDNAPFRVAVPSPVLALSLVLIVVVASAGVSGSRYDDVIQVARRQGNLSGFGLELSSQVVNRCAGIADAARTQRAGLVVFTVYTVDATTAYACSALHGDITSLVSGEDRRAWVFHAEARRVRTNLVVADAAPDLCTGRKAGRITSCTALPQRVGGTPLTLVTFPSGSAFDVLADLHIPVRAFGKNCRVTTKFFLPTCAT